jgi:hypothetical protein
MKATCIAFVLAAACGSESKPDPPTPASPPASQPPARVVPHEKSASSLKLPAASFDVTKVLGHAKPDVDQELGHGEQLEDGPWSYERFEGVGVSVMFDQGKAALVAVEPAGFHGAAAADLDAVRAWMHAPADADYDHVHNFDFVVGIWAPGMQERQLRRREFAKELTAKWKRQGSIFAANGIDLELSAPPGQCDRNILRKTIATASGAQALRALGFAMLECSGVDGTAIKL